MLNNRITQLKKGINGKGPVLYWMSRDQRCQDNWALLFAQTQAQEFSKRVVVVFTLATNFAGATLRHYDFMFHGLEETEKALRNFNIPFVLLNGEPTKSISDFIKVHDIHSVVTDFDPLRIKQQWKQNAISRTSCSWFEVDAHNVIPARLVSDKQEFGAYTLRPKIKRILASFLDEFPQIQQQKITIDFALVDWHSVRNNFICNSEIKPVSWIIPGHKAAHEQLNNFIKNKLEGYNEKRNDPNLDNQSNLSPYLHFGHLSAQRVAIEIIKKAPNNPDTEAFLEELIVRKELSDNFCLYNPNYDSINGFPDWARKTLEKHHSDKRDYIYTFDEFEHAGTHDPLWNACQKEMVKTGKMHGYMRMYWAKKILEWTDKPETALKFAIELNDKYELDGRDPNGYTGCAWAIGGVHDRPWKEREIFGMIRYMNDKGCARKFDVKQYINNFNS